MLRLKGITEDFEYEMFPMKNRKPNWSETETIILVQEFEKRKRILRPQLPAMVSSRQKHDAWNEITDIVNRHNPHVKRSVKDVRKKWQNMAFNVKVEVVNQIQESTNTKDASTNMLCADPAAIYKTSLDGFGDETLARLNMQGQRHTSSVGFADDHIEADENSEDDSFDDEEYEAVNDDTEGSSNLKAAVQSASTSANTKNVLEEQEPKIIQIKREVTDTECETVARQMRYYSVSDVPNDSTIHDNVLGLSEKKTAVHLVQQTSGPIHYAESSNSSNARVVRSPVTDISRSHTVWNVDRERSSTLNKRPACENVNNSNFVQHLHFENASEMDPSAPRQNYEMPSAIFPSASCKRLKLQSGGDTLDSDIRILQKQVLEYEKQRLAAEIQKTEIEKEKLSIEKEKIYLEKETLLLEKEKLHLEIQCLRDNRRYCLQ